MSDEHSTATDEEGKAITLPAIELSSIEDDDTRALAKRYGEQERGKMTEAMRNTLVAFVRDPAEGLKMVDSIDPKVTQRVLKDLWVKSVDELRKSDVSEDKIASMIEAKMKEASTNTVKTNISNKLSQLPDAYREVAQKEFVDLTEGRNLSGDQLEKMAEKAVNLARIETGSYEKNAKLTWGSQSISSVTSPPDKGNDLLEETNHPFFSQFNTKK